MLVIKIWNNSKRQEDETNMAKQRQVKLCNGDNGKKSTSVVQLETYAFNIT